MSFYESLSIAFSLSVDACVIALLYGQLTLDTSQRLRLGLTLASTFGFCQFLMPILGYYGGQALLDLIESFDHWVAFGLLALVSVKMLKEAFSSESQEELKVSALLILLLGIATSLDALAVGFSLGLVYGGMITLALIIGLCCFVLTLSCFYLGVKLHEINALNRSLNIVGALILLMIGLIILKEHGVIAF